MERYMEVSQPMGSFKSLGKCVVKVVWPWAQLLQPNCGHVKLESMEVSWNPRMKLTQGGAVGGTREVSLGVAHLIFIEDPSDINTDEIGQVQITSCYKHGQKQTNGRFPSGKCLDLKDRIWKLRGIHEQQDSKHVYPLGGRSQEGRTLATMTTLGWNRLQEMATSQGFFLVEGKTCVRWIICSTNILVVWQSWV